MSTDQEQRIVETAVSDEADEAAGKDEVSEAEVVASEAEVVAKEEAAAEAAAAIEVAT